MDENNNTDQENGFVLQDTPTSQPETSQSETQENQQIPEQQTPEPEIHAESRFGQEEPQPMPSQDNTYRFQNTEVHKAVV